MTTIKSYSRYYLIDGATNPEALAATLLIHILGLSLPLVVLQLYDRIIPNHAYDTFLILAIGMLIVLMLDFFLRVSRAHLIGWKSAIVEHRTNKAILSSLLNMSLMKYNKRTAEQHAASLAAVEKIREYNVGTSQFSIIDAPFAILYLLIVFSISPYSAVILFLLSVITIAISFYINTKISNNMTEQTLWDSRRRNFVTEALTNIHTVKALVLENAMVRRHEKLYANCASSFYVNNITNYIFANIGTTYSHAGTLATALFGSLFVIQGHITPGELSACMLLSGRITEPVLNFLNSWIQLQSADLAQSEIQSIISLPSKPAEHVRRENALFPHLNLESISFAYDDGNVPILRNTDITLRGGELTYLSAPSGSGKTTLSFLAAGQLTPDSGRITLYDARSICDAGSRSVYHKLIPQQATLFHGTVLDNITGFRPSENNLALSWCEKFSLHTAISELSEGYNTEITPINDNTITISIARKICLMRAFIDRFSLLIVDEQLTKIGSDEQQVYLECLKKQCPNAIFLFTGSEKPIPNLFDRHLSISSNSVVEV